MKGCSLFRMGTLLGAAAGMLALGGCSSLSVTSIGTVLKRDPPQICIDNKLYSVTAGKAELQLDEFITANRDLGIGVAVDKILDCTIGEVGQIPVGNNEVREVKEGPRTVKQAIVDDKQMADYKAAYTQAEALKAYRGYIALALLSRYAVFNFTGMIGGEANLNFKPYPEIHDDALAVLSRIEIAEKMLALGSRLDAVAQSVGEADKNTSLTGTSLEYAKLLDSDPDQLPTVSKLHRTLAVAMVGLGAEKPTWKRTKNWLITLGEAFAGAALNTEDLFDQGIKVIGKGLTLTTFGNAYLDDARCRIETYPPGKAQSEPLCMNRARYLLLNRSAPSVDDWNYWTRIIKHSCDRIAYSVGATHHCLAEAPKSAKPK